MVIPARDPEDITGLVVRTDFSDDAAWRRVLATVTRYVTFLGDDVSAYVTVVDNPSFAGVQVDDLIELPGLGDHVFVADARTMVDPERSLLLVDCSADSDEPGRSFRVVAGAVGDVQANLGIGNLDLDDYLDGADPDGVYRPGQVMDAHLVVDDLADDDGSAGLPGSVPVDGLIHVTGVGDLPLADGASPLLPAGSGAEGTDPGGIQGLALWFAAPLADLTLRYRVHLRGNGDTDWAEEGSYVGVRGEQGYVEGFAVRLEGAAAERYTVEYSARLAEMGETGFSRDGVYCGWQGFSRAVELVRVRVRPRPR